MSRRRFSFINELQYGKKSSRSGPHSKVLNDKFSTNLANKTLWVPHRENIGVLVTLNLSFYYIGIKPKRFTGSSISSHNNYPYNQSDKNVRHRKRCQCCNVFLYIFFIDPLQTVLMALFNIHVLCRHIFLLIISILLFVHKFLSSI